MKVPEREYGTSYHETKEHGGREFPFNIYPCCIPQDFKQVAIHWHEEMEIISIKKGGGVVNADRVAYAVEAGELLVLFPGQLHSIAQEDGRRMEYENIIFRPSMLLSTGEDVCSRRFLRPLMEERVLCPLHIKAGQEHYLSFMACIEALDVLSGERREGYQLAVKGQLYQFLYLVFQEAVLFSEELPSKSREKIKQVLGYIEEHYGENVDVEQAAALCFYSKSHFMKYFKQYAGVPFIRYLNEYRLSQAGGFLLSGEETVTAVAARCGFDNLSYFNRLFREQYGMTPGEYRNAASYNRATCIGGTGVVK